MDRKTLLPWLVIALLSPGCLSGGADHGGAARETAALSTYQGREVLPGVVQLTGFDAGLPELADPYLTQIGDTFLISGTSEFSLAFKSLGDISHGGPYSILWNRYFYADGTEMEGGRLGAPSWDLKPTLWNGSQLVWYGGHMRPEPGSAVSVWPQDNYSRDVFAFTENGAGNWYSRQESVFASHQTWPRPPGSYLGHRYGHQIAMTPHEDGGSVSLAPSIFYEEVTQVRSDGSPSVTSIFSDGMLGPFATLNAPSLLMSPVNPATGRYFPSALREDGAALVEGPLYFRFRFQGEQWEAIGFSAGSYYSRYPSCFASRRVADGLSGKPYQPDLTDDGSDLHDAGAELGQALGMTGGPGRPAVIVDAKGDAIPDRSGDLQILVHGYRHEPSSPNYRVVVYAPLSVTMGPRGVLRFTMPVRTLLERGRGERIAPITPALEAGRLRPSRSGSSF